MVPGPGVLNAVTGVSNCYFGSAPVVLLAGQNKMSDFELGAFHEMNHLDLMRPITKWCATAYEAQRTAEYIGIAFRKACAGMPGPTFVDFPQNILEEEIRLEDETLTDGCRDPGRPWGDPALVARAVAMLAEAERPLIVYGSGILWSGAREELLNLPKPQASQRYPRLWPADAFGRPPVFLFYFPFTGMSRSDVILFIGARLNYILGTDVRRASIRLQDHPGGYRTRRDRAKPSIDLGIPGTQELCWLSFWMNGNGWTRLPKAHGPEN